MRFPVFAWIHQAVLLQIRYMPFFPKYLAIKNNIFLLKIKKKINKIQSNNITVIYKILNSLPRKYRVFYGAG